MSKIRTQIKVFLCYAHPDRRLALELYNFLVELGVDTWIDVEKLVPGENWEIEISKSIRDSDLVLVCLSKNSVDREGFVQKEIRKSLDIADKKIDGAIYIVPVLFEDCNIPQKLNGLQRVNLFKFDGYKKIVQLIRFQSEKLGITFDTQGTLYKKSFSVILLKKNKWLLVAILLALLVMSMVNLKNIAYIDSAVASSSSFEKKETEVSETAPSIDLPIVATATVTESSVVSVRVVREMNASFSPIVATFFPSNTDRLYAASEDGVIRIWEINDGKLLDSVEGVYWGSLGTYYAFSGSGDYSASGSWNDLSVKLISMDDFSIVESFAMKDNGPATALAISHDRGIVVVSYWVNNVIGYWDTETGELIRTESGLATEMQFSSDDKTIGILYGNTLNIVDVETGALIYSIKDSIVNFSFSPDDNYIALGLSNGTVSFREFQSGQEVFILEDGADSVDLLDFSPDGNSLISSNENGPIRLWDVANKKILLVVDETVFGMRTLNFSQSGKEFVTGFADGTIRLWQVIP